MKSQLIIAVCCYLVLQATAVEGRAASKNRVSPGHVIREYDFEASCLGSCGQWTSKCSCERNCHSTGDCCNDFAVECENLAGGGTDIEYGDSCLGSCGQRTSSCSCEDYCRQDRNCCYDFELECPAEAAARSCEGSCGDWAAQCGCDEWCEEFGECCDDFRTACPHLASSGGSRNGNGTTADIEFDLEASCLGSCEQWTSKCSCERNCRSTGDCCNDFEVECEYLAGDSCLGSCGRGKSTCSCEKFCLLDGNCCHDFELECPAEAAGRTSEFSCFGSCGDWAPQCGCDEWCEEFGECCEDFGAACPHLASPGFGGSGFGADPDVDAEI